MRKNLNRHLEKLSYLSINGSAWVIFFMGLLTTMDVLSRLAFNNPLPGMVEIQSLGLLLVVMGSLSFTEIADEHISVEIFTRKFDKKTIIFLSLLFFPCILYFLFVLQWTQILKALDCFLYHEKCLISGIVIWPFYVVMVVGFFVFSLIFISQLFQSVKKGLESFSKPTKNFILVVLILSVFFIILVYFKTHFDFSNYLTIGIVGVGFLFLFIFLGFPIGLAMGFVGLVGVWFITDSGTTKAVLQMSVYPTITNYFFTVIPLFVGMGLICFEAGLSKDLFNAFHKLFGSVPGGLAMATIGGCSGFAAICGDSVAAAATMSSVALPEMRKNNYNISLATGCIAAGGTLGILIPPSIGFIVYGLITEQSIGLLFMAGVIPGLILTTLFVLCILIICLIYPKAGPKGNKYSIKEKLFAFKNTWAVILLILIVLGGIYTGKFTPTEGGGIGLVGSILISSFLSRRLDLKMITRALRDASKVTAMIFIIFVGVTVFNYFISLSGLPAQLSQYVASLSLSRYMIMTCILLLYLLLGCMMNIIPMIMLTLPLLFPTVVALGFDPIWFGVVMVIVMEMGIITPPIGMNVFVISGIVKDVPMDLIFKGIIPFFVCMIFMVILLYIFPELALWLPGTMQGLAALPS